jgi:phospholipase/carboxylesterase/glyoxalase family protein
MNTDTATTFVHRFIPAEADAPPVTLLLLHGTGGDENDLLGIGRMLVPGAALLSPRGKVLEHGMPRFFRRLAEGVFDLDDLSARTHELADFVAASASRYGFDPRHVIAVGYSNGANIAASMLLLSPETLAAAVLFRPMVPFEPESPPDLTGVPVFIAAGTNDPVVPGGQSERLAALLQATGAPVTLHWEPASHGLTQGDMLAAQQWFAPILASNWHPVPGTPGASNG